MAPCIVESNKHHKLTNKIEQKYRTWNRLTAARGEGKDQMKDGEEISQRTFMHNPWTWTMKWGWSQGEERDWGWVEVGKGRKSRNNCNSIYNLKQPLGKIQENKDILRNKQKNSFLVIINLETLYQCPKFF